MMSACFLDTNILLYAAFDKNLEPKKNEIASEILKRPGHAISTQVLLEFHNNLVNPRKSNLSEATIDQWLNFAAEYEVITMTPDLVFAAIEITRRYKIHTFDSALLAAAHKAEATIMYSEDLNHGQIYGTVRVCNPFKEDFLAFQ